MHPLPGHWRRFACTLRIRLAPGPSPTVDTGSLPPPHSPGAEAAPGGRARGFFTRSLPPRVAARQRRISHPIAAPRGAARLGQASKVCYILARQGAARKDQTLTFSGFRVSQVYASAFYDKGGAYDGHADPSPKSPMGVYGTKPGQPEPIKLQEGEEILLAFDDSMATP